MIANVSEGLVHADSNEDNVAPCGMGADGQPWPEGHERADDLHLITCPSCKEIERKRLAAKARTTPQELTSFVRFTRDGGIFAWFTDPHSRGLKPLTRRECEERLANLKERGQPHEQTQLALDTWPDK